MLAVTLSILFIALTVIFIYRKRKYSIFKDLGIPGPEPNAIFGNYIELLKKTPIECEKEWVKKYGKVVGFHFGGYPYVLVADTDLLKKILVVDFQKFMNRPLQPLRDDRGPLVDQLVNIRDKRWKDVRTILSPSFTTSKLRQMSVLVNDSVGTLVDKIDEMATKGKSFDIYEMYQMFTMEVIGRTAFGFNSNCQRNPNDDLVESAKAVLSLELSSVLIALPFLFPEFAIFWFRLLCFVLGFSNKAGDPFHALMESMRAVIKTRKGNEKARREDILQSMLEARMNVSSLNNVKTSNLEALDDKELNIQNDQKSSSAQRTMTDNEIVGNATLFLVAGYETTSTALAFTTHCLIHHQDIQDRIREEIKTVTNSGKKELDYNTVHELQYLDQVLNESLRMFPPIYGFTLREAAEDIEYENLRLKKGMIIYTPVNYLHHSPEFWEEPEKFNPDRFSPENKAKHNPMAFQPFGAGPRNCIGMRMAKTSAKLALSRIIKDYKLVPCRDSDKFPPEIRVSSATNQPAKGVSVKVIKL